MSTQIHAFRLHPGQDLKKELLKYCQTHKLQAATVISGVGSLKEACLRLANAKIQRRYEGPFEIVSLTGTLSNEGVHLHISVADAQGAVLGGHLLDDCLIYTTAEIVLLECLNFSFTRESDPQTGYKELKVTKL